MRPTSYWDYGEGGGRPQRAAYSEGLSTSRMVQLTINNQVQVSGRTIAEVVTQHQSTQANRPPRGPSYSDPTMSVLRPSLAGA